MNKILVWGFLKTLWKVIFNSNSRTKMRIYKNDCYYAGCYGTLDMPVSTRQVLHHVSTLRSPRLNFAAKFHYHRRSGLEGSGEAFALFGDLPFSPLLLTLRQFGQRRACRSNLSASPFPSALLEDCFLRSCFLSFVSSTVFALAAPLFAPHRFRQFFLKTQ